MSHNLARGLVVVGTAVETGDTVAGVVIGENTASESYKVAIDFALVDADRLVHSTEVTMTDAVDVTV